MHISNLNIQYLEKSSQEKFLELTKEKTRDVDWLMNSKFTTDYIKSPDQLMLARKQLVSLLELTEKVYPGRWDIYPNTSHELKLLIHFPYVDLENENSVHEMEDIYFITNWTFDQDNKLGLESVTLAKTSFSLAELTKGFVHSHCPLISSNSRGIFSLTKPCLGDTIIDDTVYELFTGYTELTYESFLIMIPSFLEWESLEGVPYYQIDDLTNVSLTRRVTSYNLRQAVERLSLPFNNSDLTYTYINDKIELVQDHKLELFLKDSIIKTDDIKFQPYLKALINGNIYYYFLEKQSQKKFLVEKNYKTRTFNGILPYFPFRGEKKVFRITDDVSDDNKLNINKRIFKVSPELMQSYVKKTNQYLYSEQIKRATFRNSNKVRDLKNYLRQSEISM